jgi:hypothetical protein
VKEPNDQRPMEIREDPTGGAARWAGFAALLIGVAAAMTVLLLWLTGSFLMAAGTSVGMIALMLLMGAMAGGGFDRRF